MRRNKIEITPADQVWLETLLDLVEDLLEDYPELFSDEDEDIIAVAGQLIRSNSQ